MKLIVFLISLSICGFLAGAVYIKVVSHTPTARTITDSLPTITLNELNSFNGTDAGKPIYLALDGDIYDVSAGRKFYQSGGPYHYLAGRDSSIELHLVGADIIKSKYPVIGHLTPQ